MVEPQGIHFYLVGPAGGVARPSTNRHPSRFLQAPLLPVSLRVQHSIGIVILQVRTLVALLTKKNLRVEEYKLAQ
jgi:hypothetical protein